MRAMWANPGDMHMVPNKVIEDSPIQAAGIEGQLRAASWPVRPTLEPSSSKGRAKALYRPVRPHPTLCNFLIIYFFYFYAF